MDTVTNQLEPSNAGECQISDEIKPGSKTENVDEPQISDETSAKIKINETNSVSESSSDNEPKKLSKRMERKLRKREQWLINLPAKRAKEREKMKLKRKAARENNVELTSRKRLKQSTIANSNCKVRVCVDLDFDELMNPRDIGKCVKQMMRCYTLNRRADNPMQLYFTSFTGKSKQEMSKNQGYWNWDVHFKEEAYTDVFLKDDIVYLSSESDNIVTTLDDSKVYVIGGLVDHNAHKGLCHRLAEEKEVAHAQLPISEFLELKSRKVLTIDHVFEILLGVSNGLSWKDAFLKVLPQRKGAITKGASKHESNANECDDSTNNKNRDDIDSENAQYSCNTRSLRKGENSDISENPDQTLNITSILPEGNDGNVIKSVDNSRSNGAINKSENSTGNEAIVLKSENNGENEGIVLKSENNGENEGIVLKSENNGGNEGIVLKSENNGENEGIVLKSEGNTGTKT